MKEIEKEIEKNKDLIAETLKRTGTVQLQTSKEGIQVVSIKREVVKR